MTNAEFIELIGGAARSDMATTGILASITIAQACLESAYGTSELAVNAYNLFGMKATISGNTWASEWDGSTYSKYTSEQDTSGNESTELAAFRKYASWAASIKDHSDYLTGAMNGSSLRYAGLSGCTDYRTAAQIIKDGGYATDTAYVDKLCAVIEDNNLTQYDGGSTMKICLDAGHYGKYNQSPANSTYYESDMVWKLHLMLKAYLEAYGVEVITTRTNQNTDMVLYNRGTASAGCNLFISLHSNAVGSAVNDSVDYPVSYCAINGSADDIGLLLAQAVEKVIPTNQTARIEHRSGTSGDYYGVLRGATAVNTPGLILEHSFHTNTTITNWLLDDSNLDKMAKAEADCIASFYGLSAAAEEKKSGWVEENGGWQFYLGDTGSYVSNDWYQDNDKWYWFDGAGMMVSNIWYEYNGSWYYLGADGAMVKGLQNAGGKWYYLDADGKMATAPVTLEPDDNGALQYPGLAE
ncbi:MAG: glucosaminidase domain-containing protein [Sporomusa sp.]